MSAAALLADLTAVGITLRVEGQALRFRAPAGTMTAARLAELREHKAEIVRLLADPDALRMAVATAIFDGEPVPGLPVTPAPVGCFACGVVRDPREPVCPTCHPPIPSAPSRAAQPERP